MPTPEELVDEAAHRIEKYEAHVRDIARARIGTDLAQIQAQFRADVTHALATGDTGALRAASGRAAASLRALRPAVAPLLRDAISEGLHVGAQVAGGPLPKGVRPHSDPGIRETLKRVNTPIRRHARLSANAVLQLPLNTAGQLEHVIDRIGAVITEVDAAAGVISSRAVALGTQAVTDAQGVGRIWVTRSGCCPVCASYSGSVAPPGGGFTPRHKYTPDTDGQWPTGGTHPGPPAHWSCKCFVVPEVPYLADRLARRTEADVAAGRLAASMPARIRAINQMLSEDAKLTQRTRERATRTAARGRPAGQRPATPRSARA